MISLPRRLQKICADLSWVILLFGTPTFADSANWLYLGGQGNGLNKISMLIDLNSATLQPSGVTTFKWRITSYNPLNFEKIEVDMSSGIDCESQESVDPKTGARKPLGVEKINDPDFSSPVIVAYRNFCGKATNRKETKIAK